MALESIARGVASDGNGLVLWVPAIADPASPTVAELTAAGVIKLTYSLTPDGFQHETSVATVSSGRFTLAQVIEADGTETDTVEVTYVTTETDEDIARVALQRGVEGYLVKRLAVANEVPIAADQLVTVIPAQASVQRDVPPAANSEFQIVQKLNVRGRVERKVPVIA